MIESKKQYNAHNSTILFDCTTFRLTEHMNGRYYLILKEFGYGGYVPKRGNTIGHIQSVVFDTLYQNKGKDFDYMINEIKKSLTPDKTGFHIMAYNEKRKKLCYKGEKVCYIPTENTEEVLTFCDDQLLLELQEGIINLGDARQILNDSFPYIRIKQKELRKTNGKQGKQVTFESFADTVKLESELDRANAEIYDLTRELEGYKKFGALLRKHKEFKCPNCGAPLKFIQLFNGKISNKGRLAICCSARQKNEKGKCAYLSPLSFLDYVVFHDEIHYLSQIGDFIRNEWEVSNPNHPNFISQKILRDYKSFQQR